MVKSWRNANFKSFWQSLQILELLIEPVKLIMNQLGIKPTKLVFPAQLFKSRIKLYLFRLFDHWFVNKIPTLFFITHYYIKYESLKKNTN